MFYTRGALSDLRETFNPYLIRDMFFIGIRIDFLTVARISVAWMSFFGQILVIVFAIGLEGIVADGIDNGFRLCFARLLEERSVSFFRHDGRLQKNVDRF